MTSTNDGKDVKSNQSSGQKGKTYYIELYKSLDARLSGDCDLGSRARHLCEAWRRVHSLCLHALPATHPHLFSWVERHTARTILQTEWQSPKSKDVQTSLEEAIDAYIADTGSASKDGVKLPWELQLQERGEWFKRILRNPWGHDVLRALLQGETPGDDEILGWLKEERGLMFVTRLKQLTASKSKCDDLAMGLVTAVMDRVRASTVLVPDIDQADEPKDKPVQPTEQPTFGDILKAEAGFTGDIWELLTDIEFVLLHKCDKHSKCIQLAKQIPLKNGYHLVERLQSRLDAAPREKRLWKNAKDVATLVAQVIIARCMVIPVCAHICRSALYCCSRSLARLLPASRLPAAAAALAAPAATARHLHTLAQAVDAQVHQPNQPRNPSSTDMIPFVCELYVRAITAGMNELERLKLKTEKETEGEARTAAAMLASWFTQLGALLARSLRLRSECALTAFSLHPAPDMYDKIRAAPALPKLNRDPQEAKEEMTTDFGSWTNDSRTQSNLVKTSETLNMKHTQNQANVLSTAILTEGEAIGLSPELCMDLAVLLAGPRVKTLSWDMDRDALLDNCRAYMERTDGGTRALTTELKYLNLDPASYMHLPEENDEEDDLYYGIEKGYEHLVELQEPESVWPEQYDDPEKTESACSSSMENDSGSVRRKKKTKVITRTIDSDEDEDPLSLIAEVKRMEKKKERPHSKERSSKDGSKERKKKTKSKETSDNKEGSRERRKENPDDKEKKKEKRAYKKRTKDSPQVEPKPGSLSSLVGMRVAKVPEVNHNKSPDAKVMPYVTDSDYDSQGKSSMASLNSEGNDPDVLFDGLYCMEENVLNDPLGDKNSLTNSELSVANGQVAINTARVVKKPVLDKPQILKPVDKQISKTTQNINNQVKHTPVAANMNNALPYTPGSVEQKTQSTVDLKTQTKNVNAVREHVKQSISRLIEFRRQNALLEAQRNSMSSPSSTASSPRVNSENSSTPIYKSSNVTHNDFPDSPKLPRKVEVAIPDVNKIYTTKNQIESDHKQEVDMKAAKQNKPVIPYSKYNQQQAMNYNEAFLQTFLPKEKVRPVQPQPRIVHKPQSSISDDVSQKNFQAFLKELQETINAGTGTKTTNTAPVVPKPAQKKDIRPISRVTPVIPNNMKTEPGSSSQCAKSTIQTAKKADNQLNTFARLSYMHKTKQSDFKTSKETPSLYQEQKALLNKAIEEQKSAKLKYLQSKGEIVVSRVCQAQPNLPVKDEPKVLIKKVDQPSKNSVSDHPLLKNMLHSKSSYGAIPKHAPKQDNLVRNPSHTEMPRVVTPAPVIRETSLSEKDQNDLLLLLRQQNKLNYSTPCINTDVNKTTNNIQYSNPVPASTISSLNQANVSRSVIKNYPTEIKQNNTQNNDFTNKATHVVQKMYPKAVENSPDNVSRTIPYKKINVSLTKVANSPTINTEVNQYGDNNKQATNSTVSQEGQTNRQDWESVMDALLKHKTPSRGPNALEMTLNNDGFTHSSLRNQRIMRTNVVDPESKVSDSRIQTQSVLKHTASETIVKPNRIVEGIKTDEKNRQLIQTAKHAVSDRVVRPNVVPDAEVKPLHTQRIVRPNMMINTEVKTGDNKLHTRSVAKVITDRVVRPSILRDTGIKTSHSNNPHTYIPAKQFAPENVNRQSLAIDAEVKISDIKKPQTVTRNVITERVARPGLMFNTNHKPDERSKIQPEIKHTTEKILRPNLVMDSQVKPNEPVTVAKHVMPAVIHKKINIHYSANQDSLKNQKPPQTHALKPVIEGEHLKVTDIHKKQVTANLKDSYISSIPNSDYDLLDELMDDELRQEIGELSSDEETYRSSSSNNYKGNKITTSKELSADKNIKQQDTLHSIDPRCALKPAQSAQNNVIIQAIERTNAPKIIIESDRTIVPAKVVNTERPPVQVSTNIVQQTTANAVVLNNQTNESQTFICQNVNRNHINVVNPRNVIITAVPQPVVPNVVVFGSDIVYDPFTTVQTHLQTGLCNVSQTPYITLNTAPNIAVYQTTQFTAPVVNELIIGNAMTSPMPAPATQSITSMAETQDMSTSQINTTNITEPLKDYCEDVLNDDKNVNNHDNLETKPKIDTDNLLQGKSDVKQPKTSLDINSNKNCERKVLSEVQDKQTIKVTEKVDIKNTNNQKLPEENKREEKFVIPSELKHEKESKIDLESVPKKNSRDQERLKKKRFAILNREVSHRSCADPIALGYEPLPKPIQRSPVNNNTAQHKSNNESTPDLVLNNQKVVNEEQDTDNSKENENKETPCRRILLRSSNDLKAVTGLSSAQDQKNPVGRKTKVRLKKTEEHCTNKTMEKKVKIDNKDVHKNEKIVSPIRVSKRILNKKGDKVNVEITNTNVVKPVVITQTHKNNVIPTKNDIKDVQKVDIAKNEKVTENHNKDENKDSNQPSQLIDATAICVPVDIKPAIIPNMTEFDAIDFEDALQGSKIPKIIRNPENDSYPITKDDDSINTISITEAVKKKSKKKKSTKKRSVRVVRESQSDVKSLETLPTDVKSNNSGDKCTNNNKTDKSNVKIVPTLQKALDGIKMAQTKSDECVPTSTGIINTANIPQTPNKFGMIVPPCQDNIQSKPLKTPDTVYLSTQTLNKASVAQDIQNTKKIQNMKCFDDLNKTAMENITFSMAKDVAKQSIASNNSRIDEGYINCKTLKELKPISETEHNNVSKDKLKVSTLKLNNDLTDNAITSNIDNNSQSGVINKIPNKTQEINNALKNDALSQSQNSHKMSQSTLDCLRDQIRIEELPALNDSGKKCVRIKMPNGKSFKATVFGKMHVSFESLFSDKHLRMALLNSINDTKRYTVNIKQVSTTEKNDTSKIVETRIEEVKVLTDAAPTIETVNLLSDEEDEPPSQTNNKTRTLKTEFGEFNISLEEEHFTKHQMKLQQKCLIKLTDVKISHPDLLRKEPLKASESMVQTKNESNKNQNGFCPIVQHELESKKISIDKNDIVKDSNTVSEVPLQGSFTLGNRDAKTVPAIPVSSMPDIIEIDDSSNDSIDVSKVLERAAVFSNEFKSMEKESVQSKCNINKLPDEIDTLKNLLLKDLGVQDIVKDIKTQIQDDSNVKALKDHETSQLCRENMRECYVKLHNCDGLVKKYDQIRIMNQTCSVNLYRCDDKQDEDVSDEKNNLNSSDDFINLDVVSEPKLTRSGSFSLLDDLSLYEEEILGNPPSVLDCGRSSPVMEVFDAISCLRKATRAAENYMSVMEAFELISSVQNRDRKELSEKIRCFCELHATKRDLHVLSKVELLTPQQNEPEFDGPTCNSSLDGKHYAVPTLKKLTANVFLDDSVLDLIKPCLKSRFEPPVQSPSHSLKRKIRSGEDKKVVSKLVKVMIKANIEVIKEENVKAQPNISARQRDNNINLIEQPLVEEDSTVHTEIKISNECGVKDENVSSEKYAFSSKYVLPEKQNEHSLCKIDKLPGAVKDVSENSTDQAAASNDKTVKCEKGVEDILKSEYDQACETDIGEVVEEIPDKTHVVISSQYSQKRESDKSLDENIEVNKDEEKDLTDNCRLVGINVNIGKENGVRSDQKFDQVLDKNINEEKLENNENNKNLKQNHECVNNETTTIDSTMVADFKVSSEKTDPQSTEEKPRENNKNTLLCSEQCSKRTVECKEESTVTNIENTLENSSNDNCKDTNTDTSEANSTPVSTIESNELKTDSSVLALSDNDFSQKGAVDSAGDKSVDIHQPDINEEQERGYLSATTELQVVRSTDSLDTVDKLSVSQESESIPRLDNNHPKLELVTVVKVVSDYDISLDCSSKSSKNNTVQAEIKLSDKDLERQCLEITDAKEQSTNSEDTPIKRESKVNAKEIDDEKGTDGDKEHELVKGEIRDETDESQDNNRQNVDNLICSTSVKVDPVTELEFLAKNHEESASNQIVKDTQLSPARKYTLNELYLKDKSSIDETKLSNEFILNGIEYEDPEMGTCYVFPIAADTSSSSCETDELFEEETEEIIQVIQEISEDGTVATVTLETKEIGADEDYKLNLPQLTYSRLSKTNCYTKRPLKRKIDMSDIKISEKKYRKGKNIDYPKITATAMADSAYGREFKRVLEYCSTVKFSYTQPFHKEFIDVDEIIRNWPIGKSICDNYQDDFHNAVLFTDLENVEPHRVFDPAEQTFADEISEEYTESDLPSNIPEINFSMGFGEGSDRVIQNLEDVGDDLKFSAATLSDVKQPQPLLQSENYDERTADHEEISFMTSREDQIKQLKRYLTYIQMRDKVRSFFKKTSMELKYDWIGQEKHDVRNFPFELYNKPDFLEPPPASVIVQVVQVGQLPVSATAQNPVTCDPRVTQVSDASPSQCSVDNSPQDDSQPTIKTEYTELTTADLTVPLMQEYAQHNQTLPMDSQEQTNMSMSDENIPIETEIKSVVKIELVDDTDEKEETRENYENSEPSVPEAKQENEVEYSFDTNSDHVTTPLEAETDYIEMMEYPPEKQDLSEMYPEQQEQKQQNGAPEKTDQIAHAMNAAGITTTSETMTNNTRAHALVNILSQKLRQGSAGGAQATTNTYSKTTSINAMALQQALAQILPPPLNQSNGTENSQQSQNAPQVLHIVQGKNATGSQITLVDNSQQSVINAPNATPVLHIVQNKSGTANANTNGAANQQTNSFGGLSLVDAGLQQGGNQLLHIVNTGSQKNSNAAGQLLKRVNLLTNLTNVQGSNEQKMVQFVCKSADGKAIQLNAPHQRSMVLRLQPIETPNVQATPPKPVESQDLSPTANGTNSQNGKDNAASQQEIKSRSVYEENYAKFIQNSSSKTGGSEKSTSLPKFNQAFGKPVFQDGSQTQNDINANNSHLSVNTKSETSDCQATDNAINLDHIGQISSPPLLLRKSPAQTSQAQTNLVQQLKQTITPMNIQTMHGGVIYTRQIPVNIGGGQTINLITVPSTELVDDSTQKQPVGTQNEMEQSIIKLVPQNQSAPSNAEISSEEGGTTMNVSNENNQNPTPQPVLTQMRIKLPMLSKTPQMVSGTRVVRPSFFQIQRNVIGGTNQPVYQQLVLTAAPPLGQQTIRLPQAQTTRPIKVDNNQSSAESQMSSSTLEQLREFDMVLEQVKERSSVPPNSTTTFPKLHTPSTDTTDGSASTASTETTQQVLYSIGNNHQPLNVAYVNRKATVTTPTTSTFVRSPDSSGIIDSPTSSSHVQIPHTVTSESSHTDPPPTPKPKSKSKSRPKSSSNPPSNLKLNTVPPKTSTQKPLEDEQTTQRILYILAEYKEQVENSPDKDKPAPRRRSNPPSNPSGSSKRKKSSSGSRRHGRDMSPIHGEDTCRTMGSEDSSCGTSQGDCNESCLESHSPQDSPRKVVRKLSFEPETPAPTPRPQQPQRNVIVADGQTITVARGTAGKPATAVLMPANYILPVSMVKGGQQIAIVTNRGPKLLTVGGGEGGATNALLLQRLIGPAGLKPVLARPGVRHVRLPTAALHNLQAFNLATATTIQPPDSTASPAPAPTPPELVDTRATSSPWTDRDCTDVKPERGSSPEGSEPWNLPSSGDPHDYSYEETVRTDHLDRTVLVVQKKDGSSHRQHRLTHVSAAALRHKYAILEHELRLQKSLSEECEDLGVDSPSASELFPEAELLFATSPAHEHQDQGHHSHTPQPTLMNQSGIPHPDMDDQIATDELLPRDADSRQLGLGLGGGVVGVGEDDLQAVALDQEEFARAHPNTTFHSEPEEAEVQPFTIAGLKGRHIPTIFHSNRAPATVLMTAPQTTVISQATGGHNHSDAVKYADIDNMINSLPSGNNNINLSSVLVKDEGLTRFDSILSDSRELHLSNTASAIVHSAGNATQVIRRVCYDDDKRDRFLMDEPDAIIAGDDAKMIAEDSSRDATMESMGGEMDDDRSSPERHAELFWESNSASERSESRRPLDFSSDSEKCCKSPSYDETNSTDSSGGGTHMRLDSVIKDARGIERSGSADGSSADDAHPPLRTYPPKRMYGLDGTLERSMGGKTRAGEAEGEARARRASGRGVVKRGCHCCNGEPAPSRPKKSRQRKPTMDFTTN